MLHWRICGLFGLKWCNTRLWLKFISMLKIKRKRSVGMKASCQKVRKNLGRPTSLLFLMGFLVLPCWFHLFSFHLLLSFFFQFSQLIIFNKSWNKTVNPLSSLADVVIHSTTTWTSILPQLIGCGAYKHSVTLMSTCVNFLICLNNTKYIFFRINIDIFFIQIF